MDFKSEYLGQFIAIDHEYETYLKAWLVYYKAADSIDGHIKRPRTRVEHEIVRGASREAIATQNRYIAEHAEIFNIDQEKWRQAKNEALRRSEKESEQRQLDAGYPPVGEK